jgi:hypothetical protein
MGEPNKRKAKSELGLKGNCSFQTRNMKWRQEMKECQMAEIRPEYVFTFALE